MDLIEQNYQRVLSGDRSSDIVEHLPTLRKYAERCDHVTELGVRWIVSTWAFLAANPKKLFCSDIQHPDSNGGNLSQLIEAAKQSSTLVVFKQADDLTIELEETDLLFIDTLHTYTQLNQELKLHGNKARKYIIFHDTQTFGYTGQDESGGIRKAIYEFLAVNPQWIIIEDYPNNNGLMVLGRREAKEEEERHKFVSEKISEELQLENIRKKFRETPMVDVSTKNEESKIVATNRKLKFIVPFIDKPFYLWQILIQLNNLRKFGYDRDVVFLGSTFGGVISPELQKMTACPCMKVKFHLYQDNRSYTSYPASLKPWSMGQYFKQFPEEKDSVYVYLDPDVIFLRNIDFTQFMNDDTWYEGNTASYLDSKYIKSKGAQLFTEMCMIAGIDESLVISNDLNTGGAQYVIKNNTYEFWHEVELLSTVLYKHMQNTASKYCPEGQKYPIQAWTAEMWATNWCLWKRGIQTKIHPDLDFHMANHPINGFGKSHPFLHLSGTVDDTTAFSKVKYQSSPFNEELLDYENSITSHYVREIRETKRNFASVIW